MKPLASATLEKSGVAKTTYRLGIDVKPHPHMSAYNSGAREEIAVNLNLDNPFGDYIARGICLPIRE
jgi:hypothetical protein